MAPRVHWFYSKANDGEVALTKGVPSRGTFVPFSEADSVTLERAFLEEQPRYEEAWRDQALREFSGQLAAAPQPCARGDEDIAGIPVRNGLFECDLERMECVPCYWEGGRQKLVRGTWFVDKQGEWVPVLASAAAALEDAYSREIWTHTQNSADPVRVHITGSEQKLHAYFLSATEMWLCGGTVTKSVMSMFSFGSAVRSSGMRLRRGLEGTFVYTGSAKDSETVDFEDEIHEPSIAAQGPVTHLLLVVHGVGQKMESASIVRETKKLRRAVQLGSLRISREARGGRVEVLPIQWRKHLTLKTDEHLEGLRANCGQFLSKIAHSTVMDVLYYLTPQHCQEVVDSVVNTLNRVHARFRVRHPQFTGQVSVLGHSFGSVLLWDILCHQPSRRLPAAADDARRCAKAGADGTEQPAQASEDPAGQRQGDVHQSPQMQRRAAACFDGENAKERTERQQPTSTCTDTDTDAPRPGASLEHTADTTSHTPSAISSYPLPPTNAAVAAATAAAVVDSRRSVDGERKESAAERENKFLRAEVARLHQELAEAEGRLSAAETPVPNTWQQNTINYGELAFEVDLFVLIGSPMGVFMLLRGDHMLDGVKSFPFPNARRMINCFHPYDPVAYRLEPLVSPMHTSVRPKLVPYHKGGKRLHIGMQEMSAKAKSATVNMLGTLSNVRRNLGNIIGGRRDLEKEFGNIIGAGDVDCAAEEEAARASFDALRRWAGVNDVEPRVDYMLQEEITDNAYLSALHAHTKYWSNNDLSLFLLRSLLQLPEDAIDYTWQPGQQEAPIPEEEVGAPPSPLGKLVTDLNAFQYEFP